MALEGTYEYECMRAELLGVEKPDYEEFMKNKAEKEAADKAALEDEGIKEFETQKEYFGQTSGKLDELNSILKSTQRKINNLTAPFSMFIKSKIGRRGSAGSSKDNDADASQVDHVKQNACQYQEGYTKELDEEVHNCPTEIKSNKVKDLTMEHIPLIDGLIEKTEKNVLSMEHQIKQMKRFK